MANLLLFNSRAGVLSQHIKVEATAESFRSDKVRTASVLNDFQKLIKNS